MHRSYELTYEYEFEIEEDDHEEPIETNQQVLQQDSREDHAETQRREYVQVEEEQEDPHEIETNQQVLEQDSREDHAETKEYVYVEEEQADPHEDIVRTTQHVLQRHLDRLRQLRHRRGRSPSPSNKNQNGTERQGPSRAEQLLCRSAGRCERPPIFPGPRCHVENFSSAAEQLVTDLMDGTVNLSAVECRRVHHLRGEGTPHAPFLRLSVFEDTTRKTKVPVPILKCSDNRRLFALKKYAKKSGQTVMVRAQVYDQQTIRQVKRMVANSDDTDGESLRMRLQTNKPKSKNSNHGSSGSVKRKRNRNRHRR